MVRASGMYITADIMLCSVIYMISWVRGKGNSAVKIEGGGGKELYLYNVKIGNFPGILMSSLRPLRFLVLYMFLVLGVILVYHFTMNVTDMGTKPEVRYLCSNVSQLDTL